MSSSCREFFKFPCHLSSPVKVTVYLQNLPKMRAVIFADIILEPRNIVIYYSPLIKAAISLSVPLLSSLPLKPFPPLSPPFNHLSLHTFSHPLVNFQNDLSYMHFTVSFCPSLLSSFSLSTPTFIVPVFLYFPLILFTLSVSALSVYSHLV